MAENSKETTQVPEEPCDELSKHHTQDKDQENDLPDHVNSDEACTVTEKQQVGEQQVGENGLPSSAEDIGKEL